MRSLKQKVSYNEKSPYNFTYLGNILVEENSYQQQEEPRNCCNVKIWVFAFFDDKTINFKGIEEKVT